MISVTESHTYCQLLCFVLSCKAISARITKVGQMEFSPDYFGKSVVATNLQHNLWQNSGYRTELSRD